MITVKHGHVWDLTGNDVSEQFCHSISLHFSAFDFAKVKNVYLLFTE